MKIQFSDKMINRIGTEFNEAVPLFGQCGDEIVKKINALSEPECFLTKYLYAHMPLSDVGAYSFETIESYAKHGAFLLENSDFLNDVPEEYFLQYVLAYRINSEDITDCRRFFYDKVAERVKGMNREQAVLEANNWCYEQATYRSTSIRTISPMTMYKSGFGRCGEESTFLTTILRSVGIPARQVYVPRWSHSDSNHAWVEVYLEDGWHFTGACEPKPIMDNGWFPYAASRAMVVHSRLFDTESSTDEKVTERDGLAVLLNESDRYLKTVPFEVRVVGKDGTPIKDALVRFEIINSAEFFPVASLKTDEKGVCSINLGQGSVHIQVLFDGEERDMFADLRNENTVTVSFDAKEYEKEKWISYHIEAPESAFVAGNELTKEMDEAQNKKNAVGDKIRETRINSYFDAEYTESFKEYKNIYKTLCEAKGNFENIKRFLDGKYEGIGNKEKDMVLAGISGKDCRDISTEVLEDCLDAFRFRDKFDEETFTYYLLSPRIMFEMATPFRKYIRNNASKYESLVNEPEKLLEKLEKEFAYYPDKEYTTIFSVPEGMLKVGSGTKASLGILFCAILRTFGVPARIDMLYGEPQFFADGRFVYARGAFEDTAELELVMADEKEPLYEQNYTIGQKKEDGSYETIGAWDKRFEDGRLKLLLAAGEYRILTCERTASGSVVGKMLFVKLNKGDRKKFEISCKVLKREDFITERNISGIEATNVKTGKTIDLCKQYSERFNLVMFVDPGKEPTEHVFNELLEISRMNGLPKCNMYIVLKDGTLPNDPTLVKILTTYPDAEVLHADFETNIPKVEKMTGVNGKNLPCIYVAENGDTSLYCCSGYNVGCVDIFAQLMKV